MEQVRDLILCLFHFFAVDSFCDSIILILINFFHIGKSTLLAALRGSLPLLDGTRSENEKLR